MVVLHFFVHIKSAHQHDSIQGGHHSLHQYCPFGKWSQGTDGQTKLKGIKVLQKTKGKTSKKPTKVCDDENGYEAFRNAPPADAKVKFEGVVDCETQTYTLKYSFEPDKVRNCLWLCDDSDIHDVLLLSSYVKLTFISIFHITEPSLH